MPPKVRVIIPAYNEQDSIGKVISEIPAIVTEIIVVSNNSTDNTESVARNAGATVLKENQKGYGYACLLGMQHIANTAPDTDIVVFLDGDYSDYPEELLLLIKPILENNVDMVIGARSAHLRLSNSMTPQQVFGNWLATFLMKIFFGAKFTDLGPFRAIKYQKLLALNMEDKTYGWTVEMQLKALKQNLSYVEVPVRYRKRIGVSKVSGTIRGTIMAGVKILGWIFKYSFK
ncbi:glycosyltransferase family 2 protein [Lacihabitans sp. CCS-44]|uniref:glycosyltransferase family 2 protein n=1 Tax=Lacihabitans sp. CCS-44 TaxID=2487331 RepID=UPI0020CD968E|nr:glycosyltransferase family 2 protein [Lacihabitans sp. CCS-44]MCP9756912.1 glycosyltransferase family 2 protein [Lacihabitans sp. CCS-44]